MPESPESDAPGGKLLLKGTEAGTMEPVIKENNPGGFPIMPSFRRKQQSNAKEMSAFAQNEKVSQAPVFSFDTHVTFQLPFLSQIIASQGPQEVDREIVRLLGGVRTELPMIYKPVIAAQQLLCNEEQSNHPAASLLHPHHTALNNSSCQQQRDSDFPLKTLCKGSLTECNKGRQKLVPSCELQIYTDSARCSFTWTSLKVKQQWL